MRYPWEEGYSPDSPYGGDGSNGGDPNPTGGNDGNGDGGGSGGANPGDTTPKTCPAGHTWEPSPDGNPAGRCVVTGTKWEDGCWLDTDGQIYCKNSPKPGTGNGNSGGGGTAPPKPPAAPVDPYAKENADLWAKYNEMFNKPGVKLPYDAAAIARLEGKLKGQAETSKAANRQQYIAGRSAMGLGNSGRTDQGMRNINMQADQRVSEGVIDINDTAIRANYDAEVANINRKIQVLNSQAQFAISLASNANQRQSIQYNYSIQMMQLQNQLDMLKMQLAAQLA